VALDDEGAPLCAWVRQADLPRLQTGSIDALLSSLQSELPRAAGPAAPTWNYTWELVLANPAQLADDFRAAGRSGIEGVVEQPSGLRGSRDDIYVAPGVVIHPLAVLDAEHGPIYIDEGAEIHPFTRVEGPCYVGRKSILLGAKCREGNSIGPMCRIGGEVEESIIQGYSNKYHDGFLGHAYVGQWVNLGALTTNSDLKNDYSNVSVVLGDGPPINTGSTKVGSLIGDHAKTSIGTLLNTGSYVGAMTVIVATGKPLPKFIPSFAWFMEGSVTKGYGKTQLFATAKIAMGRRKCQWTQEDQALWEAVFQMTAPERDEAMAKARRQYTLRGR
jgi:UDP-N-acetylglucosamine diphosphorylase/glucosamine-1-phosphate N-acetyltransferase